MTSNSNAAVDFNAMSIAPNPMLGSMQVFDATPPIIRRYLSNDEHALLSILRHNRLIDAFLGLDCYPLQSNLLMTVSRVRQTEAAEIYLGMDHQLRQFIIPVRAKGSKEPIGTAHIEQDMALCKAKFTPLTCRPVMAQFMESDLIALFEFEQGEGITSIKDEKHYQLYRMKC